MGLAPINRTPRDRRRFAAIQPTGAPTDVADAIRTGLANIEAAQDRAVQDALGKAQAASSGIGRGMTPEAQGAALRSALQSGRDAAKANERKLWAAIDPDGTLALPAGPVSEAAGGISNSIPRTARPMSGEEAAIFDTAQNLPSIAPFNEMTALRSRISTAMREELRSAGQSPTYARLSQLRGAVEDAINNAAAHKSVVDDAAVAAGDMAEGDSLRARIDEIFDAKLPPVKNPGKVLEQELLARPAHLRPRLLELAERHAKETGDFEMARAVKQYRDKSREIRSTIRPDPST